MNYKEYIEEIVATNDKDKMHKLQCLMVKAFEELDDEEMDLKLYELAKGKYLNHEMAEKIIRKMKPYSMKWTFEQTDAVRNQKGYSDIRPVDFWIVMNMAYNDYFELFKDELEDYVDYTRMFIKDEDATPYKVYEYFMNIPKK